MDFKTFMIIICTAKRTRVVTYTCMHSRMHIRTAQVNHNCALPPPPTHTHEYPPWGVSMFTKLDHNTCLLYIQGPSTKEVCQTQMTGHIDWHKSQSTQPCILLTVPQAYHYTLSIWSVYYLKIIGPEDTPCGTLLIFRENVCLVILQYITFLPWSKVAYIFPRNF